MKMRLLIEIDANMKSLESARRDIEQSFYNWGYAHDGIVLPMSVGDSNVIRDAEGNPVGNWQVYHLLGGVS